MSFDKKPVYRQVDTLVARVAIHTFTGEPRPEQALQNSQET
jgi:hypothetical protein